MNTTKEIKSIPGAKGPTFSTNAKTLAFVTSYNVIQWIKAATFKESGSIKNEEKIRRLKFLEDNRLLIMTTYFWKVLDVSSGKILWEKPGEKTIFQLNLCTSGKDRLVS